MNWLELQKALDSGETKQFYVVVGEDGWQLSQAVALLKAIIPVEMQQLNITEVNAKDLQPGDLEQYQQVSLFGGDNMVFLWDPRFLRSGRRGESEADRDKKAAASEEKRWQDALQTLCTDAIVVLVYNGSLDKRRTMSKWLDKQAVIVECNLLKRGDMANFVQTQLRSKGITAEYGVADRIQEIAGDAPGIALQEIAKLLISYPQKKRLSMAEAQAVLSTSIDAEVFALFDLIGERKLQKAFEHMDELLRRGESAPRILAVLSSQLRRTLQLRLLAQKGVRGDAAAKQLGMHPYAARMQLEKATLLDDASVSALLIACTEKDSMMKSGRIGMDVGLHLVCAQMAASMRPSAVR